MIHVCLAFLVSFPAILGTSGRRFNFFTQTSNPALIFKTPMNPVRKSPEQLGTRLRLSIHNRLKTFFVNSDTPFSYFTIDSASGKVGTPLKSQPTMQADDIVKFICSSLSGPPAYASGTCPIPLEQFIVFYKLSQSCCKDLLTTARSIGYDAIDHGQELT